MIFPVLMTLLLAIIQTSMWYFAREAALSAAQQGVRAGREQGSSAAIGANIANGYLAAHAGSVLPGGYAVPDGSTPQQVRITVHGQSVSLVPFWHIGISQTAQGPVERFTTVVNP